MELLQLSSLQTTNVPRFLSALDRDFIKARDLCCAEQQPASFGRNLSRVGFNLARENASVAVAVPQNIFQNRFEVFLLTPTFGEQPGVHRIGVNHLEVEVRRRLLAAFDLTATQRRQRTTDQTADQLIDQGQARNLCDDQMAATKPPCLDRLSHCRWRPPQHLAAAAFLLA